MAGSLLLFALGNLITSLSLAPSHAGPLVLVPAAMRAKTGAILLLIISLIGLGLGPLAIGLISDAVTAAGYGDAEGLRLGLLITGLFGFVAAGLFWASRSRLERELELVAD
jgi:hypothetical protein